VKQNIFGVTKIELQHAQSEARGGNMFVIPVPFSKYHKEMLAHCKELLEYQNGMVANHPRHNKLITSLRTAVENVWERLLYIQLCLLR
jgi:hypothetical protein